MSFKGVTLSRFVETKNASGSSSLVCMEMKNILLAWSTIIFHSIMVMALVILSPFILKR